MIEHSREFRRIKKLCDWPLNISREYYYLIETENGKDLGVWMFRPEEEYITVHANLGDECKGKKAADSARNSFKWIFDNTSFKIIHAIIPKRLKHVQMLARVVGFEFLKEGNDCRAYRLKVS